MDKKVFIFIVQTWLGSKLSSKPVNQTTKNHDKCHDIFVENCFGWWWRFFCGEATRNAPKFQKFVMKNSFNLRQFTSKNTIERKRYFKYIFEVDKLPISTRSPLKSLHVHLCVPCHITVFHKISMRWNVRISIIEIQFWAETWTLIQENEIN